MSFIFVNKEETSFLRVVHPPSKIAKPVCMIKMVKMIKMVNMIKMVDICNNFQIIALNTNKNHLHGESHENSTHDPGCIVPLPDDVLVRLLPKLLQAGVGGHVWHFLHIQAFCLQISFIFCFLVYSIILIAWEPENIFQNIVIQNMIAWHFWINSPVIVQLRCLILLEIGMQISRVLEI